MKTLRIASVVMLVMLTVVSLSAKEKTVEGELVDVTCYAGMGAKGSDHQMCASVCAKNGQPVGIAAKDGKIYTLLTIAPAFADYMAKVVKIEGTFHKASQSIKPTKFWVKERGKWKSVELPKLMM